MNPNTEFHNIHRRLKLIDQCWNYFEACGYFADLAQYLLNYKNEREVEEKSNPSYKT